MSNGLYFLAGLLVGGACAYVVTKRYFEQVLEEEDLKRKEYYEKMEDDFKEATEAMKLYSGVSTDAEEVDRAEYEAPVEEVDGIRVISPEELEEGRQYEKVYLTWFEGDRILVRNEVDLEEEESDIIVDIKGTIGEDALDRFGEYENDTVFVRDERIGVDYIINREETAYDYEE